LDTLGISAAEGDFNWRLGFGVACAIVGNAAILLLLLVRALAGVPCADGDPRLGR
jgi:hypothetical protein